MAVDQPLIVYDHKETGKARKPTRSQIASTNRSYVEKYGKEGGKNISLSDFINGKA